MTPETQSTAIARYRYDIEKITHDNSEGLLHIVAFNLDSQVEEVHDIKFETLALTMSPGNKGKIDAGYFVHLDDPHEGPYKEWKEVEMEPGEFFDEIYGITSSCVDSDVMKTFRGHVEEAVHKILNDKLSTL